MNMEISSAVFIRRYTDPFFCGSRSGFSSRVCSRCEFLVSYPVFSNPDPNRIMIMEGGVGWVLMADEKLKNSDLGGQKKKGKGKKKRGHKSSSHVHLLFSFRCTIFPLHWNMYSSLNSTMCIIQGLSSRGDAGPPFNPTTFAGLDFRSRIRKISDSQILTRNLSEVFFSSSIISFDQSYEKVRISQMNTFV